MGFDIREYHRQRRAGFRAAGMCSECGREPVPGTTRCEYHGRLKRARENKRRQKFREENRCVTCGDHLKRGEATYCRVCRVSRREALKERRKRQVAEGKCLICGTRRAQSGRITCKVCTNYRVNWARQKRLVALRKIEFRRLVAKDREGVITRLAQLLKGRPGA